VVLNPALTVAADDLTGAAEVAAGAAGAWQSQLFDWRHAVVNLPPPPGHAACVNTASRHLPMHSAVDRLHHLLSALPDDAWFYKKCDSTLRGPIGAEVAAVRRRFPDRPLWYIGAAPAAGRIVRDGTVLVDGVPVAETAFAQDPLFPVKTSQLQEVLAADGMAPVLWRPGEPALASDLVIADAATPADLGMLAETLAALPSPPVLAGAGAFIPWLPILFGQSMVEPPARLKLPLPALVINGTLNPVGLAQIRQAEASGIATVALSPGCLFGPEAEKGLARQIESCRPLLLRGESLIVRTASAVEEGAAYRSAAEASGLKGHEIHELLTERLAHFAAEIFDAQSPHTLITFGGELAEQLWLALDIRQARMRGFAFDCLAVTEASNGQAGTFTWATKPGGFGPRDLLQRVLGTHWTDSSDCPAVS